MIIAVTTFYHDYEPYIQYVDTEKLDPNDYVENEFLKAINNNEEWCIIDASNWEDHPDKFPDDEIDISAKANVKNPKKIDKAIFLKIDFDC